MNNNRTILVTGATGFLGFRTVERLAQQPDVAKIIAAGRTKKPGAVVEHPKVEYRLGSLEDEAYVSSLFEGVDQVVNCAALSSPWGSYYEFYQANVQSQSNLIKEAKKNGINRFVFVSTPSLYFNFKDRYDIKESEPLPPPVNQYARTKREAELMLQDSGLSYIAIRPRALIGRGDTVIMPRLIRAYEEGRLKIIGNGKNEVDLTAVSNVVDAIVLALGASEEACGEVYNITNGEPVKLWEAIDDTLARLGMKLGPKKVPLGVVKTVAKMMELKAKWSKGKEPVLTQYSVGTLAMNFTMDISKAKDKLGYEPKMNTKEAIDEFVQWYKQQ